MSLVLILALLAAPAVPQEGVSPVFSSPGIALPGVTAVLTADGGAGPSLYVAGNFQAAGPEPARRIARWDGRSWRPLGAGLEFAATDLATFDCGTGRALYAVGPNLFGDVLHRWDGTRWSSVPSQTNRNLAYPLVLEEFNGELVVGGTFSHMSSSASPGIASFDGTDWKPLGQGLLGRVTSLAVHDDGTGETLYAGGRLYFAGSGFASVARWDGAMWEPLDPALGLLGIVYELAVFGEELIAIGNVGLGGPTPGSGVARWDGVSWNPLGSGIGPGPANLSQIWSGGVHDLPAGEQAELVVVGSFTTMDGVPADNIAAWNGESWRGIENRHNAGRITHAASANLPGSAGTELFAAGPLLGLSGGLAHGIARWNGVRWRALTRGQGTFGRVLDLQVFDDGSGEALFACGWLGDAGGVDLDSIGRWDGSEWSRPGDLAGGSGLSLEVFDDGAGSALYMGGTLYLPDGSTTGLAKWDGLAWSNPGGGVQGEVIDQAVFDDGSGPALLVIGNFSIAGNYTAAQSVARWDGQVWSAVGGGLPYSAFSAPNIGALAVFDDGSGPRLYVAGSFSSAGNVNVNGIASWDGTTWQVVPDSPPGASYVDLLTFDDGTGEQLYAAGQALPLGGPPSTVWRFDGTRWEGIMEWFPGSFQGGNRTLSVYDRGDRPVLLASGLDPSTPQQTTVAAWDGSEWNKLFNVHGQVQAMTQAPEPAPALFLGGFFQMIDGVPSTNIGRWSSGASTR